MAKGITPQVVKATYVTGDGLTYTVDSGNHTLASTESIPAGAIVTRVWAIANDAPGSDGSATIQVLSGTNALTTAEAVANFAADKCIVMTLYNSLEAVYVGTTGDIEVTVGTADLKDTHNIDIFVEYLYAYAT
jgi:hypothetical protein